MSHPDPVATDEMQIGQPAWPMASLTLFRPLNRCPKLSCWPWDTSAILYPSVPLMRLFGATKTMIDQSQLENLTVGEKLQLVTSLWDQIAQSKQPICVPNAVLDDAERRVVEMIGDPTTGLTEEEMWRRADENR